MGYARDVLGATVTPQQAEIAARLSEPPYRVLVPSANNVGKTFSAGWLINHRHDSYDPGIVLATSSTARQVKTQLFKEVRRLRPFGLGLQPRAPYIGHKEDHFVLGFSTNKADSFQGHHEGALTIIMDEATGVDSQFWDRAETMFQAMPGHGWVCFYNPNDTTTAAYAQESGGGWHVCRLSAVQHPNIAAELEDLPPPVPSAIRLERLRQRIAKGCEPCGQTKQDETCFEFDGQWWLPTDPLIEVQALGRWPSTSQQAVWSEQEWKKCLRSEEIYDDWPVQIGCDPARRGSNKIAIAVRKGLSLIHLEKLPSSLKSPAIADHLRSLCYRYAPPGTNPKEVPVLIDDTGGYGSGICDYPEGYNFVGVVNSRAAMEPTLYPNTRCELWWCAKIAADEGGFILGDLKYGEHLLPELQADFLAARYAFDSKDRRVIESKDSIKERIGRSPDLADTVCLAWYPHWGQI